jgi:hypothetical protein
MIIVDSAILGQRRTSIKNATEGPKQFHAGSTSRGSLFGACSGASPLSTSRHGAAGTRLTAIPKLPFMITFGAIPVALRISVLSCEHLVTK